MEYGVDAALDFRKQESCAWPVLPEIFTLICFVIFIPPHVTSIHLTNDPNVRFWMGDALSFIALVLSPALIIAGHIPYRLRGAPTKWVFILSLIGPSLVFGILANHMLTKAMDLGNEFAAADCARPTPKFYLQESWRAAQDFYDGCQVQDDVNPNAYLIHNCLGYYEKYTNNSDWQYLAQMEIGYRCGGWCEPSATLWTYTKANDSCSTAISQVMSGKIVSTALQIVVYSMCVLTLTATTLILLGPSLHW